MYEDKLCATINTAAKLGKTLLKISGAALAGALLAFGVAEVGNRLLAEIEYRSFADVDEEVS